MVWSCPPDVSLCTAPLQRGPAVHVFFGEAFSAAFPSNRLHNVDRAASGLQLRKLDIRNRAFFRCTAECCLALRTKRWPLTQHHSSGVSLLI